MKLGVLEAKNRLSELLDRAVAGEEVVITRRGEPEVVLTPLRKAISREEAEAGMARWDALRDRYKGPVGTAEQTKADINAGRRF
jgi:prevent-host-death family protein